MKTTVELITIIAVNLLMWDFVLSQFLFLLNLFYDNNWILLGQVITTVASILAWLWVHYSKKKDVKRAERYTL